MEKESIKKIKTLGTWTGTSETSLTIRIQEIQDRILDTVTKHEYLGQIKY